MEFIVAMRLHALIFATKVSTPIIGLSYDPKVDDLIEYIGISNEVQIDGDLPNSILKQVESVVANKAIIKKELKEKTKQFEILAKKDIDNIKQLL